MLSGQMTLAENSHDIRLWRITSMICLTCFYYSRRLIVYMQEFYKGLVRARCKSMIK